MQTIDEVKAHCREAKGNGGAAFGGSISLRRIWVHGGPISISSSAFENVGKGTQVCFVPAAPA